MPSWIPTRTFRTYPREGEPRMVVTDDVRPEDFSMEVALERIESVRHRRDAM
jgi:hypothetical protein